MTDGFHVSQVSSSWYNPAKLGKREGQISLHFNNDLSLHKVSKAQWVLGDFTAKQGEKIKDEVLHVLKEFVKTNLYVQKLEEAKQEKIRHLKDDIKVEQDKIVNARHAIDDIKKQITLLGI